MNPKEIFMSMDSEKITKLKDKVIVLRMMWYLAGVSASPRVANLYKFRSYPIFHISSATRATISKLYMPRIYTNNKRATSIYDTVCNVSNLPEDYFSNTVTKNLRTRFVKYLRDNDLDYTEMVHNFFKYLKK